MLDTMDVIAHSVGTKSEAANPTGSALARLSSLLAVSQFPASNWSGLFAGTGPTAAGVGVYKSITVTNPGTTLTTALNITGIGLGLVLRIRKPATVNSVNLNIEFTVDGTIIYTGNIPAAGTAAGDTILVGCAASVNASAFWPRMIQFFSTYVVKVKYSAVPGGSESIFVEHFTAYR